MCEKTRRTHIVDNLDAKVGVTIDAGEGVLCGQTANGDTGDTVAAGSIWHSIEDGEAEAIATNVD